MLDIEAILKQFELIEQKVEHVVRVRKQLQSENKDLNDRIGHLENLIQEKAESERKQEELTALVRSKIDNLIGKLEETTQE